MSSTHSFLFILTLSFSLLFHCQAYASATCYQPNGDVDSSVVPCNSTINSSACCDPLDSCSTSGLCLGSSGFVYRSACTDPTWSSPNCPQICLRGPYSHSKWQKSKLTLNPRSSHKRISRQPSRYLPLHSGSLHHHLILWLWIPKQHLRL